MAIHSPDSYQGVYFSIVAKVPDAYHHEKLVELRIHSPIPPMRTSEDFYRWLLWRLTKISIHETMEFFQVSGKPWADPHREM